MQNKRKFWVSNKGKKAKNLHMYKRKLREKRKVKTHNIEPQETESSDDKHVCILRIEHFNNSKSKEVWVNCTTCHLWAHKACTPGVIAVYLALTQTKKLVGSSPSCHIHLFNPLCASTYCWTFCLLECWRNNLIAIGGALILQMFYVTKLIISVLLNSRILLQ